MLVFLSVSTVMIITMRVYLIWHNTWRSEKLARGLTDSTELHISDLTDGELLDYQYI